MARDGPSKVGRMRVNYPTPLLHSHTHNMHSAVERRENAAGRAAREKLPLAVINPLAGAAHPAQTHADEKRIRIIFTLFARISLCKKSCQVESLD
jgi:hypothetical protein